MPPLILSTIVQLLSLGITASISVSISPFSGQKALLMGRSWTVEGMPAMLRWTLTSSLSFSLLMFSTRRPVLAQTQLQEQRVGESWLILPLRCARSMHACSTISSQPPFSFSMPTWWLPHTSRVSSKFWACFHSGMMMRQQLPWAREALRVMLLALEYLPSIQRYPLNSLCTSSTRTHMQWQSSELLLKNLPSFCCTEITQSLFWASTSFRIEYSALSWCEGLYFPIVLVESVLYILGEQRKTRDSFEKASWVSQCSVKSGGQEQDTCEDSLEYLRRRMHSFLVPPSSPIAKESTDSRLASRFVNSFSDLFLRTISRGESPVISLRKSMVLPSPSSSQAEQQWAKAFSSKQGQISSAAPSSLSTVTKAGTSLSWWEMTGMCSSRMTDFQLDCWKMRTRYSPYWLKACSSNILQSMQLECLTALKATATNWLEWEIGERVTLAWLIPDLLVTTTSSLEYKSASLLHWIWEEARVALLGFWKMEVGRGGNILSTYFSSFSATFSRVCLANLLRFLSSRISRLRSKWCRI